MTLLLEHRVVARFRDCDPLGHVNNAVYSTYLEQARFALWREQLGYRVPGAEGAARGVGFILARLEIDFVSQARQGDELDVRLSLASIGRSSFVYEYTVVDASSARVVAKARSVQVRFDYDTQKSVPIDDDLRASMARPCVSP
jgi:acyl-CoA thioester hydrolase